jgi:hypothetical protein
MPARQKYLLIALVAAVLVWQGGGWLMRLVFEPIAALRSELAAIQERVDAKTEQLLAIERAKSKLRNWQARSLPPDPGKKKRPDAVDAQRQYTEWLTELAHAVGFEDVDVNPQRRSVSRNSVYVEVVVQIEGIGRLSQLYELLDRFYRTDLLQRIGRLQIVSEDVLNDPPVRFSLEAAGLALADAPTRRTLFPKTRLAADLEPEAESLSVESAADFPKKAPFRIRLERELLDVADLGGLQWLVRRGVERTQPAAHPANASITLLPINRSVVEVSPAAFRELVRTNPFVKPAPAIPYDMTFGPFPPALAVRGKTLELSLAAKNFDPARGDPTYRFVDDPPPGATLNPSTGQLEWKPGSDVPAGEYLVTVEARHPSAPKEALSQEIRLTLVEPNTPPKFGPIARQTVYRGQSRELTIAATDSDEPPQKLTFKLAAGAPPSCQIDAASGLLRWTPPDDQPLGPATLSVTVTDDGVPPQSATLAIFVDVREDTAKFTELIGIVAIDDQWEAWFYDKSQDRKSVLRVGDQLAAADVSARVVDISKESVTVRIGRTEHRMKLGDTVRSLTRGGDASSPAPAPDAD